MPIRNAPRTEWSDGPHPRYSHRSADDRSKMPPGSLLRYTLGLLARTCESHGENPTPWGPSRPTDHHHIQSAASAEAVTGPVTGLGAVADPSSMVLNKEQYKMGGGGRAHRRLRRRQGGLRERHLTATGSGVFSGLRAYLNVLVWHRSSLLGLSWPAEEWALSDGSTLKQWPGLPHSCG